MEGSREQNVSTNKVERKVMEKNQRNHMKSLYSHLYSLIPTHHSNESPLSVSDQIEQAINYIKSLEMNLKEDKEKKERLIERLKRSSSSTAPTGSQNNNNVAPELQIKEMGSAVEVVLTTGLEDQFIFYEIIRIIHEERVQIINAGYSVLGNTAVYSLHGEIEDVVYELGATKLSERLNRLVYEPESDAKMQWSILRRRARITIFGATRFEANWTENSVVVPKKFKSLLEIWNI